MPNLNLKRRVGPLPVWAWGVVGVAGVGVGLYLRNRGTVPGTSGEEFLSSDAALPVDVTPGTPAWESVPPEGDPVLPDLPAEPEPPILPEPELFGCPEGYLLDIFGRCVPDPGLVTPGEGPTPNEPTPGEQRRAARLKKIRGTIRQLQRGGVTRAERRRIQRLRERRRKIKAR